MATLVKIFTGEYDLFHRTAIHREFDTLATDPRLLILDMSAVTYVDSSFIAELTRLHELRAERGFERLTIVRVAPTLRRVFKLLYVDTFCRMIDRLKDALPRDGGPIVIKQSYRGGDRAIDTHLPVAVRHDRSEWVSRVLTAAGI